MAPRTRSRASTEAVFDVATVVMSAAVTGLLIGHAVVSLLGAGLAA